MKQKGRIYKTERTIDGDLIVSFTIEEKADTLDKLNQMEGEELEIGLDKYSEARSGQANRYLWKLCGLIAEALGSDKDTIYKLMIMRYGIWADRTVIEDTIPLLLKSYKYIDTLYTFEEYLESVDRRVIMAEIRCYFGSHTYNKKEFSRLLNGVISEAQDIGIETWTDEEIRRLIKDWRAKQ